LHSLHQPPIAAHSFHIGPLLVSLLGLACAAVKRSVWAKD